MTFATIEEVGRRADIPVAMLWHMAAADGFDGMGPSRREANRAIKALRDEALPLFAAADDQAGELRPEALDPASCLHR
jgi:error-prone DNA polymerase